MDETGIPLEESELPVDDFQTQAQLLWEAAYAQQGLAAEMLQRLNAHTEGLSAMVCEVVHQSLLEDLAALKEQTEAASTQLRALARSASRRILLGGMGLALAAGLMPLVTFLWLVPSHQEIEQLEARRAQLQASIHLLDEQGARIDLRRCGVDRFCVRIDRRAPVYGERGDYYVIKGY